MGYYLRMPFGRHRGQTLDQIPVSYLRWVLANCHDISLDLRRGIQSVLAEAEGAPRTDEPGERPPPADWAPILKTWYGALALKYHPDRGGTHEQMIVINEAYDRLRSLVGVR
jgi:hypothetical protein